MQENNFHVIGQRAHIDEGVVIGYRYPGSKHPTRIGNDAIIRSGSIIYADTTIGDRFSCGHHVLIRAKVTIGNRVVVYHKSTLEGRNSIGSGVKIMAHVYIPSETVIGDMVFIGPGVTILNDKRPMRGKTEICGVTIEDHVSIGGNVTICPGVTIGFRSFVAAGAVVTKDVPPDTLACGVPARFQTLPESLSGGNLPRNLLPQTDLWGAQEDVSWRIDLPEFVAKNTHSLINQGCAGQLSNQKNLSEGKH